MVDNINFSVNGGIPVRLHIDNSACVDLNIGAETCWVEIPPYEGDYEANALFSEQVFPTKSKRMTDDFTVHAINYTEAPNEYGTTVTIGG